MHRTLRLLKREGFEKIVINLHHLGETIKESVGVGEEFGLDIYYSEEPEILGTAGGIKAAQHLIGAETFLVMNGDILVDAPLARIFDFHKEHGGAATLVLKDDPAAAGYGDVRVDDINRVRQIAGRPPCPMNLRPMLFTGIQVIEPVFFDFVAPGKKASSTSETYPAMIRHELSIHCYEYSGYFMDIGSPERYEIAKNNFR